MQELERRELCSALINWKCWLWMQLATATCYQPLMCVNVAFYFYPRMIPKSIQMMPTNTFIWKLAEVISSWTIVHKIKLYTATSLIVTGVCSFCLVTQFHNPVCTLGRYSGLDYGLNYGLDYGLDYGLNFGLHFGPDSIMYELISCFGTFQAFPPSSFWLIPVLCQRLWLYRLHAFFSAYMAAFKA